MRSNMAVGAAHAVRVCSQAQRDACQRFEEQFARMVTAHEKSTEPVASSSQAPPQQTPPVGGRRALTQAARPEEFDVSTPRGERAGAPEASRTNLVTFPRKVDAEHIKWVFAKLKEI